MMRYHRLETVQRDSTDQRQYQVPTPLDTSRVSGLIQGMLERKALASTKWGITTTALRCANCRAIYRHDLTDLTHCLCCGQPLITVDYTNPTHS